MKSNIHRSTGKSESNDKRNRKFITLCYDHHPEQREFVFAIKGRPFSMLSTQKLPTPTSTLIDHNLVKELGLKMEDIQCSKFTFAGHRFRILGRISQSVQTVQNGVFTGVVHMRASVVENLSHIFDSHSIAGKKMAELLQPAVASTATAPSSPRSSRTPASSKSEPSSASSSPAPDFSRSRSPSASPSSSPSAAALNNLGARRKRESPPRKRSQPGRELQFPRVHSPPAEIFFGRVTKHGPSLISGTDQIEVVCSFGEDEIFYKTLSDKDNKPFPDHYKTMKPGDAVILVFHQYEFSIGRSSVKRRRKTYCSME